MKAHEWVPLEERRKEMRAHRNKGNWNMFCGHGQINANTINMTSIAVTNVHESFRECGKKNRSRKHRPGCRRERYPKLMRFCASCGLLDNDLAESMSVRELCDGFVDVGAHAANGLGRTARMWADDMGRHAKGFAENLFGLIGCMF